MDDTETAYLLSRAREEAVAAIQAGHPSASASHQRLSLLYSAKAILELAGDGQDGGASATGRPGSQSDG